MCHVVLVGGLSSPLCRLHGRPLWAPPLSLFAADILRRHVTHPSYLIFNILPRNDRFRPVSRNSFRIAVSALLARQAETNGLEDERDPETFDDTGERAPGRRFAMADITARPAHGALRSHSAATAFSLHCALLIPFSRINLSEFYQTLLREFLEGSDAGGTSWQTVRRCCAKCCRPGLSPAHPLLSL